jgi:3-deoxy-D-manno-octulosonic-acid transferase
MTNAMDYPGIPVKTADTEAQKKTNRGFLRYQAILVVLFPVLLIYTAYQAFKYQSWHFFLQRVGVFSRPKRPVDIWLHTASVGEVNASLPLIKEIQKKYPEKTVLVTTTTPTGAKVLTQKKLTNTIHQYLSIDYRFMVSNLLKHYRPKCVLIMETEIWPNLFRLCYNRNIPLCTVNGRLSRRTLDTTGWIRSLLKSTLQYSSLILTRSDNDSKAYIALGANPDKVKTIGNIKFSVETAITGKTKLDLARPYVLAASTHASEELMIASLWKDRELKNSGQLLVVVPRHPQRLNDILAQLQELNLDLAVRSRNDTISNNTDIYIADTIGELIDFMAGADIIFMGGSLVPIGGHNVLEPAALGKPMVFGPYMENFASEAELLTGFAAAIQVDDLAQLGNTLEDAQQHPDKYSELGSNAKHIIERHKDTASRYVAELSKYMDAEPNVNRH